VKNQANHNNNNVELQYKNLSQFKVKHFHFSSIDSTNSWAKRNLDQWQKNGVTLITTEEQTEGRGRFQRVWMSPKNKNIYATFCIFLDQKREDIGQIPQLLALSLIEILENHQLTAQIKWPNDLLIEGGKVAGILSETTRLENQIGLICGIGVNVNMRPEEMLAINQKVTSLSSESGKTYQLSEILEELIDQFLQNLQIFLKEGFTPFFNAFKNCFLYQTSQEIYLSNGLEKIRGRFIKINEEGSIQLLLPDGQIKTFQSGEIITSFT